MRLFTLSGGTLMASGSTRGQNFEQLDTKFPMLTAKWSKKHWLNLLSNFNFKDTACNLMTLRLRPRKEQPLPCKSSLYGIAAKAAAALAPNFTASSSKSLKTQIPSLLLGNKGPKQIGYRNLVYQIPKQGPRIPCYIASLTGKRGSP